MKLLIANKKHANAFVGIFNNLSKFSDAININFTSDYMYIQGMDNSHCSLFEIKILSKWFESYECHESITIGIAPAILYRVLNTRDENQLLFLECGKDDCKLQINFKNLKQDQKDFPKEFEIPLIDLDIETLHIPDGEYDMEVKMSIKSFSNVVDQLCIFGDNMSIDVTDTPEMNLSSEGHEGKMTVNILNFDNNFIDEYSMTSGTTMNLQFSLKYIHMFTQFSKVNKDVTIKLSDNVPMEVYFTMEDSDDSYVRFFLAPRIDDN